MRTIFILTGLLIGQIALAQPGSFSPNNYSCENGSDELPQKIVLEKQKDQIYNLSYAQFQASGWFGGYVSTDKGVSQPVKCEFNSTTPYIATCYNLKTDKIVLETSALYSQNGVVEIMFSLHAFGGKALYGNSFSVNQCQIK